MCAARSLPVLQLLVLVGLLGCAPSILPVPASTATRIHVDPQAAPADWAAFAEPATIEVRYYAHSPTVTLVGWESAEINYGLRAWLRRDGALIGGRHRLYVSTYYTAAQPVFTRATLPSRPLELTRTSRDVYSCIGGPPCLPFETFGALIPDDVLRSIRDSLTVTFYDRVGRELLIAVHRTLIDAYLARVDSVVAVMRTRT